MINRRSRLVLLGFASLFSLLLLYQGHHDLSKRPSVAFLRHSSNSVLVRVRGEVLPAGVRSFPKGTTVTGVINMTNVPRPLVFDGVAPTTPLNDGDIVTLSRKSRSAVAVSLEQMTVRERILLGIPLHPDEMSLADWESVPGVGPKLARDIVDDRQKNGVFGTIQSLSRVPGIGLKKLEKILKFF